MGKTNRAVGCNIKRSGYKREITAVSKSTKTILIIVINIIHAIKSKAEQTNEDHLNDILFVRIDLK